MIEMMSIEPHDGRMELEHSTKSVVRAQSVAKSARAVIFSRPQAGFLAASKIASILSAPIAGEVNVQSDLGLRVGLAAMRGCPCGWYRIPTPPVLSAVLSAGRAARDRSRTASLQW